VWRLKEQLAARPPVKKQLWRQLIQAKIRGQARNLVAGSGDPRQTSDPRQTCPARSKLLDYARQVRSGDASNLEAQAARVYWQHWLPEEVFRRDADASGLNSLLNYGYSVLRAAVARAIVAAGMQPSLGLKHSNRSNSFCLADDLLEPLRPIVDDRARELYRQGYDQLDSEAKAGLLKLLAEDVRLGGETGPLMVCLHRYTASLVRCFRGEAKRLEIPEMIFESLPREPDECTPLATG